jgi:hypothetical protein
MFVQYFFKYVQAPVFVPNSLYDTYGLIDVQGISCLSGNKISGCDDASKQVIEAYHQESLNTIMQITGMNQNGAWSPACLNHCYFTNSYYSSPNYRVPQHSDYSLITAVADWIEGKTINPRHIDFGEWPVNRPCSGL